MAKEAGKRYNITIPLGIAEKLERWARIEANGKEGNATGLAGRIVIQAVYDAEQKGILPVEDKAIAYEHFKFLQSAFQSLIAIGSLEGFSMEELAEILGCQTQDLEQFTKSRSKSREKRSP